MTASIQRQRHLALGLAVTLVLTVVLLLRHFMPPPPQVVGTVPTGASFNLTLATFQSSQHANIVAANVEAAGFPTFTRSLRRGGARQVIVGPYVSIDEAEAAQRSLARRGFGRARMLVDESIRRTPGVEFAAEAAAPAAGAGPGIVMVGAAGRVSLVFELPSEPRQVATRRAAGSVLEVEAGPVSEAVPHQEWSAPDGVALINQISLDERDGGVLRARVSTPALTQSNVRVVGRRVYIDFWKPESRNDELPRLVRTAAVLDEESDEDPAPPAAQPDYREAIAPILTRVGEIAPFLMSAVESPTPEVLSALTRTLLAVQAWMGTLDAPQEWTVPHRTLVDAIGMMTQAADPAFQGDRVAQVRQALARVDATAAILRPPSSPTGQP